MGAGATIHPFPKGPSSGETVPPVRTLQSVRTGGETGGFARWRTDLKWVFGIPFTLVLGMTLAVLALFLFTSAGSAQKTIDQMNAPLVSEPLIVNGETRASAPGLVALLESPDFARRVYEDSALLDKEIARVPDGSADQDGSIPAGSSAVTSETDSGQSPGQGISGMLSFYAAPVKFLSGDVHDALGIVLFVLTLFSLVFGIPYIACSRRLGRAVSAGVSLAFASWIPFAVMALTRSRITGLFVQGTGADASETGGGEFGMPVEDSQGRIAMNAIRPFVENAVSQVGWVYGLAGLAALACFAGAAAGYVLRRSRRGPRSA